MTTVLPPSIIDISSERTDGDTPVAVSKPATQIWFPNTIPHQKVPKLLGGMVDSWDMQKKNLWEAWDSLCQQSKEMLKKLMEA